VKWKRIFKIIPISVFYTEKVKGGFAGVSYGPWIKMRPEYKDDNPLLQHELTHCKQWYRTFGIHGWLVLFGNKKHIFESEVEAYAVQASLQPELMILSRVDLYATFISTKYGLNVTKDEAKEALMGKLETMGIEIL